MVTTRLIYQKIRAVIIGDGETRTQIENYITSKKLEFSNDNNGSKLFCFTSWIKEIDVVCAGADIIALTSFNEGTPVSLVEAQAANKPIITTNVGGIENVIIPYETALLCENNHLNQFAEGLLRIVEDEELRASMGKKGWLHVKEKFHFTRLVSDMENLYSKLLKKQY